mmetsp:Transcript_14662/g.37278  ORF Transcript_14662/g.37278 Transcript_14662/m.37278 type:complete len:258 (+) Transcript_14662:70-843(+)
MFCCCANSVEGAYDDTSAISAPALSTAEADLTGYSEEEQTKVEPSLEEPKLEEPKLAGPLPEEPKLAETQPEEPQLAQKDAFEFVLDTTEHPLGIVVDYRGGTLMVVSANSGAAQAYNDSSEASKQVQTHDFILKVNEVTDHESMVKELGQKGSLKLKVQRTAPFRVSVSKGAKPLGMKLAYVNSSVSICVQDFLDGAVADHNSHAAADAQIKLRDRIIGVGDIISPACKAGEMVEALKTRDPVDLLIARANPDASC